ncbi:MAG: serine kinase [Candidatus Aminicenantes bacterium]|nr:serine kinase [Candidatus Aminicenantes bacterium]
MKLQEIVKKLDLQVLTKLEEKDVQGVFISDLLSDVMTSASAGDLWLTVQTHHNIIAVANLVNVAAVVVTHGKKVPEETIALGNRYHVVILSSAGSIFDTAAKLNAVGLKSQ